MSEDEGNFAMDDDDDLDETNQDMGDPADDELDGDDDSSTEDDGGIVLEGPAGASTHDDHHEFHVLSPEQLTKEMLDTIADVQSVVQVRRSTQSVIFFASS